MKKLPPVGRAITQRRKVAPRQQRRQIDRGQCPRCQPDRDAILTVQQAGARGEKRILRDPDHGGLRHGAVQRKALRGDRGIDGGRTGPGIGSHGDMGRMGHLVPGHQGQVQEQRKDRQRRQRRTGARGFILQCGGQVDAGIDAQRLDQLGTRQFDPVDAIACTGRVTLKLQQIARPQIKPRGRQGEAQSVARDPRLGQPALGDLPPFGTCQQQGQFGGGHRVGRLVRQDGFLADGGIVGIGLHETQPHTACHRRFGGAAVLRARRVFGQIDKRGQRHGLRHPVAAHHEAQHPVTFHGIKAMGQHQRLQRRAGVRDL